MLKISSFLVGIFFLSIVTAKAQTVESGRKEALKLFDNFYGHYDCSGGNARGQKISAEISFLPALDGNAMEYEHIDHPPLKAHTKAIWNFDAASKRLVSLSTVSIMDTTLTFSSLLVSNRWSADSLMFNADTLVTPPFRPNRFIYKKNGEHSLHITWQVKKDEEWVMGDYLQCEEADS
jgi:hypothetical protein